MGQVHACSAARKSSRASSSSNSTACVRWLASSSSLPAPAPSTCDFGNNTRQEFFSPAPCAFGAPAG